MTSKISMALAMTGLVSALVMGLGAGSADASTPARATAVNKSFAAQQVKASKMKAAQLRQQQAMMRKSAMMKQGGGMKLPVALPVELPTEIGGCKLSMKSWQSTLNKMLKEEC